MTNIQAISLLKDLEQSLDDYCELNDEGKTAFHMAITALEVFGNSEQLLSEESERSLWFRIGEICVDNSKGFISAGMAVEKVRELLREAERQEE